MLQLIRDKISGWIAYLIIFLISVPFALWGVNSYLGGGEALPVATVNGQDISTQALDTAYANYRRQLAQAFGGSIPDGFADESLMKARVLSQMIEELALQSYVESNGYRIGDQQLNEAIRSLGVFQDNGQFDVETYQRQVASLGYTAAGFEVELRRNLTMEQLQAGIAASVFITPKAQSQLAELENETRKIRFFTKQLDYGNHLPITDAEITAHFEASKARYMTDEVVKVDYIDLNLEAIKSSIDVSENQIKEAYERFKSAYTSTEVRTASHILLTVPPDASESESNQLKERLAEMKSELESGVEFSKLAQEHSQDTVSSADGGNLGDIERGMMSRPFETALFDLEVGEVSQPVKTAFGWHLIKLQGVSGGQARALDDLLRAELTDEIKTKSAESQIYDLTEHLANLTYEQPDSLVPASEQLGLEVKTTQWFGRSGGDGIASEAKVVSTAFSSEVLAGRNSEAIELADGRILFIHLNAHKPAIPQALDQVRNEIIAELQYRKGREENIDLGTAALEALDSGQSFESVASDWRVTVIDPGSIRRDTEHLSAEVVKRIFSMEKPKTSAVYAGIAHANGDYSIVELLGVESSGAVVSVERLQSLQAEIAGWEYQSVLAVLTDRAEVVKTPIDQLQEYY